MDSAIHRTTLEGLLKIQGKIFRDQRGEFFKNYSATFFNDHHLHTSFPEQFITTSGKNVLRGFHFQTPPHEHVKVVSCIQGEV